MSSDAIVDLYTVPIGEGMKNLFVLNDTAYFQSNGSIKSYHLDVTGSVATVKAAVKLPPLYRWATFYCIRFMTAAVCRCMPMM